MHTKKLLCRKVSSIYFTHPVASSNPSLNKKQKCMHLFTDNEKNLDCQPNRQTYMKLTYTALLKFMTFPQVKKDKYYMRQLASENVLNSKVCDKDYRDYSKLIF